MNFANDCIRKMHLFVKENLVGDAAFVEKLRQQFEITLSSLDTKISSGIINPHRNAKVAVQAFSANPLHWGHILSNLMLLDELNLSKSYFLVQGEMTYKKHVPPNQRLPKEKRHTIVKNVLEHFQPLLEYSDIGFSNDTIGEYNCMKLFNDAALQTLYYFTGSETKQRVDSIIHNLTIALENIPREKQVVLALIPMGEYVDLTQVIADQKHTRVAACKVLSDYSYEIHSTQFRNGENQIVPKKVLEELNK